MAGTPPMDELERLTAQGLPLQAALKVINGSLDEAEALRVVAEAMIVEQWMADHKDLPSDLKPVWDLAREHFHLALDGHHASDPRFDTIVLVEADLSEIMPRLTFQSTRGAGPWSEGFRRKTAKTAYRWSKELGVTPPLIRVQGAELHIEGGMHRFHLTNHLGEDRIPFLLERDELAALPGILPSATFPVP